jgi:carboxyl-terminal processing protease
VRIIAIGCLLLVSSAMAQEASPAAVVKEAWQAVKDTYVDMPAHEPEWQKARTTYVKPYKNRAQAHAAIRDMVALLHNSRLQWLSAADVKTILPQFSGPLPNLGLAFLSFEFLPGENKVITALANSPAAQAGIHTGDVLESVNGTNVSKMSPGEVVRLLDQAGDNPAKLGIKRSLQHLDVTVTPAATPQKAVSYNVARSGDHVSAQMTLREFTVPAIAEFSAAVKELTRMGATEYTIDLSNNPGGLIDAVMDIGSLFVSDKEFVCMKDAAGKTSCRNTKEGKVVVTAPVTILVNEGTASAAEVFAAGMQRSGRGQVIGCRSYGHGYGGQLTMLPDGSALLIPDSSYLDPDGQPLEGRGINPDVVKCPAF